MAMSSETKARINRQAQQIRNEQDRITAANELAVSEHKARKADIRQELIDLNLQLKESSQLKHNLSEVLREKKDYRTYHEVDQMGICIGLQISRTSGQIALMTEEGIQVLESHWRARYNVGSGHHRVECFTPLELETANVDGLFNKKPFKVGRLADDIAKIVLQSPNKK